jgi:hypothetical protein
MNIRTKLDDFNDRFELLRNRIHTSLFAKEVLTVENLDDKKLSEISAMIRAQFGEPYNDREADASAFIEKWGKDAILGVGNSQVRSLWVIAYPSPL